MNKIHEYLGVDLGMKKSGIARGNSAARLAEPLETVKTADLVGRLKQLADGMNVSAVVFGLPRSLDGNDTNQTRWVRQWVKDSSTRLKLPLYWQDEAMTTKNAQSAKAENDDSAAASAILQDFLDSPDLNKVIVR